MKMDPEWLRNPASAGVGLYSDGPRFVISGARGRIVHPQNAFLCKDGATPYFEDGFPENNAVPWHAFGLQNLLSRGESTNKGSFAHDLAQGRPPPATAFHVVALLFRTPSVERRRKRRMLY